MKNLKNLRANATAAFARHHRLDRVAIRRYDAYRQELRFGTESNLERLAAAYNDADTRANNAAYTAACAFEAYRAERRISANAAAIELSGPRRVSVRTAQG